MVKENYEAKKDKKLSLMKEKSRLTQKSQCLKEKELDKELSVNGIN